MSSILRQPNFISTTQDQRFTMFYDNIIELKGLFYGKVGSVHINQMDYKRYCFMMFVRDLIQSLDRSSQIIFYHMMKKMDIRATVTVTSLNESKIDQSLRCINNAAHELLETFNYEDIQECFWRSKSLVDDLIYSYDKSDAEIVAYYGEEVAVIKILRLMSKFIFEK
ncbi:hypothetical protein [Lysinibacillus pakistanensis]|uniref:hypothetical protein n=1 Tax=Lysinibacillus pakistanensis TaxID=759811 RepID=UPI003D2E2D2A